MQNDKSYQNKVPNNNMVIKLIELMVVKTINVFMRILKYSGKC